jgi:hypothetical protein
MSFLKVYDQVANVVKSGGDAPRGEMNTLRIGMETSRNLSMRSRRKRKSVGAEGKGMTAL